MLIALKLLRRQHHQRMGDSLALCLAGAQTSPLTLAVAALQTAAPLQAFRR